jgi:Glyoxalase-like domain
VLELDHLFVCVDVGAPEAERLVDFGLTEGTRNVHPGQGTANRRFFFRNAFLELLWVHDPVEAQSEPSRPTGLWSRWSQRNSAASPFAVCLRPARPDSKEVPFPSWEYRPSYLPAPKSFYIARDTPRSEPMWCYLSFGRRPDAADFPAHQPLEHTVGFQEITHVRITTPSADDASQAARIVSGLGMVALANGSEHLLELTFDGGTQGRTKDFRPAPPLVFRW